MPKKRPAPTTFDGFLGAAIENRFSIRGRSQEQAAQDLGWSTTTGGRKMRGDTPLTVSELLEVSEHLGVPGDELVNEARREFARHLSEAARTNNVTEIDFEGRRERGEIDSAAQSIDTTEDTEN